MVPVSYDEEADVLARLDEIAASFRVKRATVLRWATARFIQDTALPESGELSPAALVRILPAREERADT